MSDQNELDLREDDCDDPKRIESRKFDFMEIFNQAHALARERNEARNLVLEENGKADNMVDSHGSSGETLESAVVLGSGLKSHNANESNAEEGIDRGENSCDEPAPENPDHIDVTHKLDPYHLPIVNEIALCHGSKPLTALAVDSAGARVATGGFDFEMKLWDFGGMDMSCRPFKTLMPCEEHQIKHLEFSPSGEYLLVISGSAQAQILTRDGDPVCFTNRGFQYITDPASAKGHTHAIHWANWHPLDSSKFLTCSQDATLRIWDVNDMETMVNETRIPNHKSVLKPRNAQGRKVVPTTCAYSKDGHLIAAGCFDGSLQLWDTRKPLVNTSQLLRSAHPANTTITCVAWSWDARQLASRASDDTLKLWDVRAISKGPVSKVLNLPVLFDQTEVTFSPNDHVLLTAVSAPRDNPAEGRVVFYRRDNLEPIQELKPGHGSVIRVQWHHRINQVFCTSSDGTANVRYDPETSHHGALMCASKEATAASVRRRLGGGEAYVKPYLLTYNEDSVRVARKSKKFLQQQQQQQYYPGLESQIAVAAVQAIAQTDRQAAKTAKDEHSKSRAPVREEKLGNRVGSLHQYMVQQIVLQKNEAEERAEKDIRGAILRHADVSKKQPFWTKAYLKTQPNAVFHNADAEVKKDDTPAWKKQKLA